MKNILLVATGGTIASGKSSEGLTPKIDSEQLLKYVPEVKEFCHVTAYQLLNIDSSNIQPEDWIEISKYIAKHYEEYDGFVITHGTDTMSYTAAMLSYLIQRADKPIVITGAQKPIDFDISDGRMNLRDAIRFACFGSNGIHVVFNGKAILGTRARKIKTKSYDAFASINYPYAAYIDGNRITKYVNGKADDGDVYFYNDLHPNVFLLKLAPGMKPDVIDYISDDYDAIVIESYGSGGIPFSDKRNFLEKLASASSKGKIIVIATQVMEEGSDAGVYKVGKLAMKYPILQAYDMTIEASITKLMWILAQTKEFEEVRELFYKNIHEDILYTLD